MDLTHLFKSSRYIQTESRTQQHREDSDGSDREVMFKKKGFNFYSLTSDSRIIRSSQETDRRKSSRHFEHWKSRTRKEKPKRDKTSPKTDAEKENKEPIIAEEVDHQDASLDKECLEALPNKKSMQQSRREKLQEFIAKRQILEDEKRKKSKPIFRAGGVVKHPYSAFGNSEASGSLHNHSKLSMSTSNLSSLFSNSSFKKPQPRIARSASLTSFRSSKGSSQDGGKILNVIEEYSKDLKPAKEELSEQAPSFAPQNFEFKMELKVEELKEDKSKVVTEITPASGLFTLTDALAVPAVKTDDDTLIEEQKFDNNCIEKEKLSTNNVNVDINEDYLPTMDENEDAAKVKPFRNLLETETERLTALCNAWESKIPNIPDDEEYEDIRGEVRSVVGQGRLVMAERFHQFSGLVDNCQFKRGEKETTVEDLQGFWEMIFIQVEDVDKKFAGLVTVEENSWKPIEVRQTNVPKSRNQGKSTKPSGKLKQASSGLKALIAARRKAAKTDQVPEVTVEELESTPSKPGITENKDPEAKGEEESAKTFDGGFFTVKSPMCEKKSPRSCRSSSNKIRQAAFTNSAKKVNTLLLSPFISAVAKMSLTASPLQDASSSPAKAPKPMVLFEADEDESDDEESPEGSPKIDERYFRPSAVTTPASCVDLISFESPRLIKEQ